ncbi:MAG: cell wall-binding repeat-containing protein [Acidimicrobiales bacterium]
MAAVARGNGFSDGLAGAVVTGNHMWPLLLTENPTTTGSYLTAFLKNAGAKGFGVDETATNVPHPSATYRLSAVVIFGGTLAITPTVVKTIQTDLATGLSP